jgi:hypothetical protein
MTLNVSFLTTHSAFAVPFSVTRRATTVGTNGRTQITETTVGPCYGTFNAIDANDNILIREPDYDSSMRYYSMVTKTPIFSEGVNYKPDIITLQEGQYMVKSVYPYAFMGAGFYRCLLVEIDAQNTNT